jgi:N-acetylneuraminic acid mutarotase
MSLKFSPSQFLFAQPLEPRLLLHGETGEAPADAPTPTLAIHERPMMRHGAHGAKFVVRRDGDIHHVAKYKYLIGGSAKNGRDYFRISGKVRFAAGRRTASINIKPKPAMSVAPSTVMLTLVAGDGYELGRSSATAWVSGTNTDAVAAGATPFSATRINFQTTASSTPSFYNADTGATYGLRSNGLTYGWNTDITANARDRNSANSPDQRYDTLNQMQKNGANSRWEIAVPNGTYTVRVVSGDPDFTDSTYRINVENVLTVSGTPTTSNRWIEGTQTVTVSDGRLTISNGSGAANDKVSFVEISPGTNPIPVVRLAATDASASESGDTAKFTVSRTGSTASSLVVTYSIGGSASNGTDYNALNGAVTIPTGSASATITITPKQDTAVEGPESVSLKLNAVSAYSLAQKFSASATIADDDTVNTQGTLKWTSVAGSPTVRAEAMGAVANGKVYAFGGYVDSTYHPIKRVDEYDPASNTWTRKADMPVGLTHAGVTTDGTYIYLAGGYPGTGTNGSQVFATTNVWRYDPGHDSWLALRGLPSGRGGGGMQLVGRSLYFYGGSDGNRIDRDVVWSFNLDDPNATWVQRASLPSARNHVGGAVINGKLYVLGGQQLQDNNSVFKADLWRYDPATNQWTAMASLIYPPRSHIASATMVRNGHIIIAGGEGDPNRAQLAYVDSYDPSTNAWTRLTSLPGTRSSGIGVTLPDNRLFFTSGFNGLFRSDSWVGTIT